MSDSLEIFVACLPGLEPFVAQECTALGAALDAGDPGVAVGSGGVPCRGDRDTVMRLNLGLGCASHVLVRIARFRARHFAELQKRAESVAWGDATAPNPPRSERRTP